IPASHRVGPAEIAGVLIRHIYMGEPEATCSAPLDGVPRRILGRQLRTKGADKVRVGRRSVWNKGLVLDHERNAHSGQKLQHARVSTRIIGSVDQVLL